MALMQASATAVFRSSMRSAGKPISFATLAAVPIATFSNPSRDGSRTSTVVPAVSTIEIPPLRTHPHQSQRRHVVVLRLTSSKAAQLLPQRIEDSSTLRRVALKKRSQQAFRTKFFIALKNLGEAIGVEEQPRPGREVRDLRLVFHDGQNPDGRRTGAEFMRRPIGPNQEA